MLVVPRRPHRTDDVGPRRIGSSLRIRPPYGQNGLRARGRRDTLSHFDSRERGAASSRSSNASAPGIRPSASGLLRQGWPGSSRRRWRHLGRHPGRHLASSAGGMHDTDEPMSRAREGGLGGEVRQRRQSAITGSRRARVPDRPRMLGPARSPDTSLVQPLKMSMKC
jgi:hypothetical protein